MIDLNYNFYLGNVPY